jgi:NADP-dependent 3-hydroxy acid dehydrogenase YdfG
MKHILITGAGSGLGRGTAIGLAQAGHDVVATTQVWPQVTDLRREVAQLGLDDKIVVDKLDVLDARDVAAAMKWDFDTLVSNAGTGDSGPMAEIPVDLVRRTFETNVFSNLELIQHAIRKFVDAGTRGRIVIVSSMGGMLTAYGLGAYCASKHALEGIAATLRDELVFNDRLADSTYHWQDDATNFTQEADIRASFDAIMQGQLDPQEMIDKMVEVIGAEGGKYRNVWPPATEELIKQVQEAVWTLPVEPAVPTAAE